MPAAVVAAGTFVVVWALTAGWYLYEDGDCGAPGAKCACLVEMLVAAGLALLLGPLLLWWAYRAAGVRKPLLSTLLAAAVALPLATAVLLVEQVVQLAGGDLAWATGRYPAPVVALLVTGAVLAGGTTLSGPYRGRRAGALAGALVVMVGTTAVLVEPVDRARTGTELAQATVPLLVPDAGWELYAPRVYDGDLSHDAVPVGWDGYGFEGVKVSVSREVDNFGESCSYRPCLDEGDVRRTQEPGDDVEAWRIVSGHLVTVRTYSDMAPDVDPVGFLTGITEVTAETFVDRLFTDR